MKMYNEACFTVLSMYFVYPMYRVYEYQHLPSRSLYSNFQIYAATSSYLVLGNSCPAS